MDTRELASGLRFPEGPVATDDGDVILVEIARGTLTKVGADGRLEVVANVGGGRTAPPSGPTAPCTSPTTAAASAGTR